MTSPDSFEQRPIGPSAWLFAPPGAGDMQQLQSVVRLVDAEVQRIDRIDPIRRVLVDRIRAARRLPAGPPDGPGPPWPDLALIAGGRSVIDARRLALSSGGRTGIVCIGRPWAPLDWFDLVITTPQYGLPRADNLLQVDLPLNLPRKIETGFVAQWREAFANLPRPLLGVLLGGDSGSYRFTGSCAVQMAGELDRELKRSGGSAVVVGSPRTPEAAFRQLQDTLQAPAMFHSWRGDVSNPYQALLHLADALAVTGDSASMLAEACYSGRPVALLHLGTRFHSRAFSALRQATPQLTPLRSALTRRGWWLPARDMALFHDRLLQRGWIRPLAGITANDVPHEQLLSELVEPVRTRILELVAGKREKR